MKINNQSGLLALGLVLFMTCSFQTFGQNGSTYEVHLKFTNTRHSKVFLRYFSPRGPVIDSAISQSGTFVFRGKLPADAMIGRLFVPGDGENLTEVWLENAAIRIVAEKKLDHAIFEGTDEQRRFTVLQQSLSPIRKKNNKLDDAYNKSVAEKDDEKKYKLVNEDYPALFREKQEILGEFIRQYPASLISAYKFEEFCGDDVIDLDVVEPVFNLLDEKLKEHPRVKKTRERIAITKLTAPGKAAPEFIQNDTLGNAISLKSFRGKYLLIDFWAGWCMPCRAENPHLRKMYERYRNNGFEILGVSLDGERKRWTDAIRTDQLTWVQVSDLNIFDNSVAKLYGVISIPQNILIDPSGIVVAWNLRGELLEKKLQELFK